MYTYIYTRNYSAQGIPPWLHGPPRHPLDPAQVPRTPLGTPGTRGQPCGESLPASAQPPGTQIY